MENMKSFNEDLSAIKTMIDKLAKGELTIDELGELETLTRKLYERSVILKYKAFEDRVSDKSESKEEDIVEPAPVAEEEKEEPEVQEESAFDFSIFDEEEDETVPEELEEKQPDVEEHKSISVTEEVKEDEVKTEIHVTDTKTLSFSERFNIEDNSLASRFAGGKLDSLVGAFGLNERLRFINNLFDGSSEIFSEAVKTLDSQGGLDEAMEKINEYAVKYDWEEDDDSVHEFMNYLNRRYA